jgi:hypothetical protein
MGVAASSVNWPERGNHAPRYDILVTHKHWPLSDPGVPTLFECQADDIHARLDEADFLIPEGAAGEGACSVRRRSNLPPSEKVIPGND